MELRDIEALKLENQVQKSQLENYEDDFKHEREDRTRAVQERLKIEDEFDAYKNANAIQMAQLNKRVEELSLRLIEKDEVIQWFEGHNKKGVKTALENHERMKMENKALSMRVAELERQLDARKKQQKLYQKQNDSLRRGFNSLEKNANSTEDIMQVVIKKLDVQLNATTIELEAAKEEIAVKVAQVKQYQKQVEAYKQQLEQCRSSVGLVPCQAPQLLQPEDTRKLDSKATSTSERLHHDCTDSSLRGPAKSACDGNNRLKPSSAAPQNAASNCVADGGSEEDDSDDDLPPPIFYKPFQPMYHPAVAQGKQKEDIPLSQLEASKLSVACHQMVHTNGNTDPDLAQAVNTAGGIDEDISQVAAIQRETDYRWFEETYLNVPLDPNLKCPICRKVFKKGRIQKFKRHVQTCQM